MILSLSLLPFIAFHCLSLPFIAFHCLSLPFIAFHCLSLPGACRSASRSSASVLLSQGGARAELASGILAWRQRAENGSQLVAVVNFYIVLRFAALQAVVNVQQ